MVLIKDRRSPTIIVTRNIVKFINYEDSPSVKALREYNNHKNRWKKIILEAKLSPEFIDKKAPDPLVCVIREYDLTKRVCRVILKRLSGKQDPERRKPIL